MLNSFYTITTQEKQLIRLIGVKCIELGSELYNFTDNLNAFCLSGKSPTGRSILFILQHDAHCGQLVPDFIGSNKVFIGFCFFPDIDQ